MNYSKLDWWNLAHVSYGVSGVQQVRPCVVGQDAPRQLNVLMLVLSYIGSQEKERSQTQSGSQSQSTLLLTAAFHPENEVAVRVRRQFCWLLTF